MSNIRSLSAVRAEKKQNIKNENLRLDEASLWIARIDRGLLAEEKGSLKEWIAISPKNLTVLLEVAKLWDKMQDLERLADIFPKSQRTNKSNRWGVAIAASIALIFAVGTFWNFSETSNKAPHYAAVSVNLHKTFSTGIGESNKVKLPDGSVLLLNTNTLAEINYTPKARIIELKKGELNIEVAHNKSRPLSVVAAGKVIQAVGTAFNVEVRNDAVELIVTEGKVLVAPVEETTSSEKDAPEEIELPRSSVAVSKGERIDLSITPAKEVKPVADDVVKVAPVDIAASLSWKQGNLIFRGESLEEAMAEISRYSDVKLEIEDDQALKNIRVAGIFRTGDISGLLSVLKQNFNIQNQRIGNDRIVLRLAKSG